VHSRAQTHRIEIPPDSQIGEKLLWIHWQPLPHRDSVRVAPVGLARRPPQDFVPRDSCRSGLYGVPKPATAYDIGFREAIRVFATREASRTGTAALVAYSKLWQTQLFKGRSAKRVGKRRFCSPPPMT
jgi:hypothetical protein